jgi:hypothetical protein
MRISMQQVNYLSYILHSSYPWEKMEYNEAMRQIFIDLKKGYDSISRNVLYNILTEFVIPMKLVRLIKTYLNETYVRVHVVMHLSDMFHILNGLKQENGLRHCFSTLL